MEYNYFKDLKVEDPYFVVLDIFAEEQGSFSLIERWRFEWKGEKFENNNYQLSTYFRNLFSISNLILSELKTKPDLLDKLNYQIYKTEVHSYFSNEWEDEYKFELRDKKTFPFDISVKFRRKILNIESLENEEDKELNTLFNLLLNERSKNEEPKLKYSFKDIGSYCPKLLKENEKKVLTKTDQKLEHQTVQMINILSYFEKDEYLEIIKIEKPFQEQLPSLDFSSQTKSQVIEEANLLLKRSNESLQSIVHIPNKK